MAKVWLFNPENDIALARGDANFTAPPAAVEMRVAGELLPLFLAEDDDRVICSGVNNQWFNELRSRFGLRADIWNHVTAGFTPSPWGWSLATKRYFERIGFDGSVLPDDKTIERWRRLSHRRTAAKIGDLLAENTDIPVWDRAVEVDSEETLREMLSSRPSAVVKQPWSSSGRGVRFFDIKKDNLDNFVSQTVGSIRRQGSVMVERFMPGHSDFALLFECRDGSARFVGSSIFGTDSRGNYSGNLVASEAVISGKTDELLGENGLCAEARLIDALRDALDVAVAREYEGPVGVDVCVSKGVIHICELNLRYTMGFVARGIARHLADGAEWLLSVKNECPAGAISLTQPGTRIRFVLEKSI